MKSLWPVALVLFCSCSAVVAKEFRLPDAKPVATVNVPDSWKPVPIEKGVQGQTADNSVYLSVETAETAQGMSAIIDDVFAVLKDHNVDLDHHVKGETKFLINGLPADELLYDGKDRGWSHDGEHHVRERRQDHARTDLLGFHGGHEKAPGRGR